MSLSTEEKLENTHEMRIPQIVELLDMSETTYQKVTILICSFFCNIAVANCKLFHIFHIFVKI